MKISDLLAGLFARNPVEPAAQAPASVEAHFVPMTALPEPEPQGQGQEVAEPDAVDVPAAAVKLPRGVRRHKFGFEARYARDGVEYSLGVFKDPEAASLAYQGAIAAFYLRGVNVGRRVTGGSQRAVRASSGERYVYPTPHGTFSVDVKRREDDGVPRNVHVGTYRTLADAVAARDVYFQTGEVGTGPALVNGHRRRDPGLPKGVRVTRRGTFEVSLAGRTFGTFASLEVATAVAAEAREVVRRGAGA